MSPCWWECSWLCGAPAASDAGGRTHQRRRESYPSANMNTADANRTIVAPDEAFAWKLQYTPPTPQKTPMPIAQKTNRWKLLVNIRAVAAGITIAATINMTPSTCIDTTTVAANTRANAVSAHSTGTPYTLATSGSNVVKRICL